MKIQRCLLWLPSVLSLLLITGCLSAPTPPIKLGTNLWSGYEPLYVGRAQSLLAEDEVALVELLSASEVMRAFRNGAIDAAALTLDEVISLRHSGLKPVIIQVADISRGADVILGREGMRTVSDLRGQRVGVEATALGAYMLSRALSLHQLSLDEIDVVHLEVNEHRDAFLRGTVDAVVTFEPVSQQLLEAGAVSLFDSSMIPGEIVDVLVMREGLLDSHHHQIQHLITAWQQSLVWIREHPDAAAAQMSKRLKLTPAEVLQSQSLLEMPNAARSADMMRGSPSALRRQAEALAASMHAHKLIDTLPDLEGLVYSRYPDA
ncbi:NitT/TauT family transport system substrate-binding protein [Marinobacterium halophilum]|uniref:NitT/TauT family transport system substrate-binding protein n=1 Tax=Marinobacterium halophilum TaxID=267374 RepID=A0A2P8ESN3_9GAMM|nr:ABC transporter substrate-binding protein [Marinobacterium halophilum]PSL12480.1 NitT/TauT family transport system substrate-binding protein [Marinobacterium halophilum]